MRPKVAHNRDLMAEASTLLSKFRALQSIMFTFDYADAQHVSLVSSNAETLSQAVSSSSPRIYTNAVETAQDTWDTAEIQNLVVAMKMAGKDNLAALKALLDDALAFLLPVYRAREGDPHSLAGSDLACDLMYNAFDPVACADWKARVNQALSNRVQILEYRNFDDVIRALRREIVAFEARLESLRTADEDADEDMFVEEEEEEELDRPKAKQKRKPASAIDDEEIARQEQEKEYNRAPMQSPAEVAAKIKEAKASAEVEKTFAETRRQFDLGLLQISDAAVPAGGSNDDTDGGDEGQDGDEEEEDF